MNEANGWARRYHWLGEHVSDFVCEPHNGIEDSGPPAGAGRQLTLPLLNMVAAEADANRRASTDLVRWDPDKLMGEVARLTEGPTLFAPAHHPVLADDINLPRLRRIVVDAHERDPADFVTLLGTAGVGPATVRSLSLLAELIYQAPASHRDPATPPAAATRQAASPDVRRRWADYSYAHGGKDGHPFPVDRDTYDRNIATLTEAIRKAKMGEPEKMEALRRLSQSRG